LDLIEKTIASITRPDEAAEASVGARLDALTKPIGSLGRLEEIVRRYAAIRHDPDATMRHAALAVFVADHGVAESQVSAYPKSVTTEMLRNIGAGGAAISVLARRLGYQLIVTDVGVENDTSATPFAGVRYRRVAPGTRNFLHGPAMSLAEARRALEIGIETAHEAATAGATLIGLGEMGIGNSTAATTILAALTGIAPARLVGRGTGIDDAGLERKRSAVEAALRLHRAARNDGMATLTRLGGLEIAAMAGTCLGAAAARVPVVVDGFIATASAAVAERIRPRLCDHLFFGHRSSEGGHPLALEALGVHPVLDLGMRLGEGTGAALAMSIIESALALFHEMATFASAGVSGKLA
jgi:nicotinate-nucleotide--dimethylbenzimidazole phosphoribosyltransferase